MVPTRPDSTVELVDLSWPLHTMYLPTEELKPRPRNEYIKRDWYVCTCVCNVCVCRPTCIFQSTVLKPTNREGADFEEMIGGGGGGGGQGGGKGAL